MNRKSKDQIITLSRVLSFKASLQEVEDEWGYFFVQHCVICARKDINDETYIACGRRHWYDVRLANTT